MNTTSSPTLCPPAVARQSWLVRHRSLLTALLLALAAWCLHLPSVWYGYVYFDDVRILRDHPEVYGQADLTANLRSIFVTSFPREEPLLLRDVTWVFDSQIFGFGNPIGYHLGNVLLHGIVVALLFAFLLVTTRRYGFALATAGAFLILAVHTEPVAWIMGRKDILSALWMLLALCAQTRRLTTPGGGYARAGWYTATFAFLICGLLSKINVLTFPLVLFLHAVFLPYLRGERPPSAPFLWGRGLAREVLLFIPCLVASGLVYMWYRGILTQMGVLDRGYTAQGLDHLWNLLMINPMVFWVYLQQMFLPSNLTVLYTWPALEITYPHWQVGASLVTVVILGGSGVWLFRRHKDIFFYYASFFVLMVTYLNLVYIGIWVAERYIYFSSFCLLAIACSLVGSVLRKPQSALRIGVLAAIAVFAINNLFQKLWYQQKWRDGETLWQYHVASPRSCTVAYENLAAFYNDVAFAESDLARRSLSMHKMEVVVEAGLEEFWRDRHQPPPRKIAYLLFLRSVVQEVKGEPEAALETFLTSDRLRSGEDATNLRLARLYRKLADAAVDLKQRETYARASRERFAKYIALAFRGRPASPKIRQEIQKLEAEYPFLGQPVGTGKTEPADNKSRSE